MEFSQELLISWVIKLAIAIAIFIFGNLMVKALNGLLKEVMQSKGIDNAVVGFVGSITHVVLMVVVLIAAMSQLGVDTTSLVAVIGAAGLAVGLALQGSLSNFASGVLIVVLRPFKSGDFIEAGGSAGSVVDIQIFSTTLKTPDNKIVIIPNAAITGGPITNFSAQDTRRIDLVVGVSYDADIKLTKEVLTQILDEESRILKDPAYTVAVSELADSSVNFVVRPWVNSSDYWGVYFSLLENIKIKLDENNIGIPYPQLDLHLHKTDQQ